MRSTTTTASLTMSTLASIGALAAWAAPIAQATEESTILSETNPMVELNPGESATIRNENTVRIERAESFSGDTVGLKSSNLNRAPKCIEAKDEKGFIQVYNNCGGTEPQRIKVIVAFGEDSECKTVQPGTRTNVGPMVGGRIDGVYLC